MNPEPRSRDASLDECLVEVLGPDRKPVGEGVVAGRNQVVTCAHVVNAALGRELRDATNPGPVYIRVRFPFSGPPNDEVVREFRLETWLPDEPEAFDARDGASLRMRESIPSGARVPTLVPPDYKGGAVLLFGPEGGPRRTRTGYVRGEVLGRRDSVRWQVDQEITGAFKARKGFSGGPVWDRLTSQVVGLVQAVPADEGAADVYVLGAELIEQASGGDLRQVLECPYVGLQPYTADHADRFFGRSEFVETLVEAARTDSLLVVTGRSGFGKSSVVLAGLVPRLASESRLAVAVCTLSEAPFEELAGALARAASHSGEVSLEALELMHRKVRDEGLPACAARVCNVTGADRLLLILDQFERIENCQDHAMKERFLDLLSDFADRPLGRVQLVVIARSDFHEKFALMPGPLGVHFQTRAKWLRPISPAGLRDAIMGPIRGMPVTFEEGLVELICEEFRRSELPHLQLVLTRLWERQVGHRLALKAYTDLGGVANALAHYADECLKGLGAGREEAARRILTRLVMPDTYDVGCHLKLSDLSEADRGVAEKLRDARLVTIDKSPAGEEIIEIAHEALLRKWGRLREWLDEDAEFRRWFGSTALRRNAWLSHDRDPEQLLGGGLLAQARDMCEQYPEHVAGLAEFIKESEAAAARAELERRRALDRARAVRLAGQSEHVINSAPSRLPVALALGVYALRRSEVFEADFAIRRALKLAGRQRMRLDHAGAVRSVAFSADGSLLATASTDRTCQVWDVAANAEVARLPHGEWVADVAFSRDGGLLGTAGADGFVRVWDFRAGRQVAELQHGGPVAALAFGRDDRVIATASNDGTARIWEFRADRVLGFLGSVRTLRHDGWVTAVSIDPTGALVVTASDDATARVWDVPTGDPVACWKHDGPVRAVVFNRAGTRVATASEDGTARVFDPAGRAEILRLVHHDLVTSVAFSRDGQYLASANEDGTARVWNVGMGFEVAHVMHQGQVSSVDFSPDGTRLATAGSDGTARLWDVTTGQETARLVHELPIYQAVFSEDGEVLATASEDKTARVWQASAGAETLMLRHGEPVSAIAFSGAGDLIATAGGTGGSGRATADQDERAIRRTVRIWDAGTGAAVMDPLVHPGAVHRLAFGGAMIATACDDKYARIWNARDGALIAAIEHGGPVRSVAFDRGAELLASASNDRTARIWDVGAQREVVVLPHDDWVGSAVFSPDARLLATAADNKAAFLWRVADCLAGEAPPRPTVLPHKSAVYEVVFDCLGTHVATVANDGVTRIWDATTGRPIRELPHGKRGAVFSRDGSMIATAGEDGTARVWRTDTGGLIARFVHEPAVRSVAFNRDGTCLATAAEDGSARIWSLGEQRELTRLLHGGEELVMAFSPDSLRLATASEDGTGRLWALSHDELVKQACDRLTRNLTQAEWDLYLPEVPYSQLRPDLGV